MSSIEMNDKKVKNTEETQKIEKNQTITRDHVEIQPHFVKTRDDGKSTDSTQQFDESFDRINCTPHLYDKITAIYNVPDPVNKYSLFNNKHKAQITSSIRILPESNENQTEMAMDDKLLLDPIKFDKPNEPLINQLLRDGFFKNRNGKSYTMESMSVEYASKRFMSEKRQLFFPVRNKLRRVLDEKDRLLLNYHEKERFVYLKNKSRKNTNLMVESPRNSSVVNEMNNDSSLESVRRKDKSEDTETTGEKDHESIIKDQGKTPLDYLLEEAHQEQQKMRKIEKFEIEKNQIERDRQFAELKAQESRLIDEIEKDNETHYIPDDIFEIRIENDIKMYYCPKRNCNKGFPSLSRVRRHYIVHTGDKPYKCRNKDCKKRFSRKDNMLQHFRNHCLSSKKRKFKEFEP